MESHRRMPTLDKDVPVESEPLDKPGRFWTMYGAIIAVILFVGWKQPLRYRFMSKVMDTLILI